MSGLKMILTGATGAAGLEILRAALADSAIAQITVLARKPLPPSIPPSEKLTYIAHSDFMSYPPALLARLQDHGACVWALGPSSVGMKEAEYTRMTRDFPVAALTAFHEGGVAGADGLLRFVYVSGLSADPEGTSSAMFKRVKGLAEKDLSSYASTSPTLRAHHLRPGYFFPSNRADAASLRSLGRRVLDHVLTPVLSTMAPSSMIDIEDLGRFAVEVAKGRFGDEEVFPNKRMIEVLKEWKNDADANAIAIASS